MKIRLLLLALAWGVPGWAGTLSVNFDQVQLSGMGGGTLTFSGTITNNTGASVSINGASLNLAAFDASNFDATDFLVNAPLTLPDGATSADFPLFTVSIPSGFAAGIYVGSLDVQGGTSSTDFSVLGTGNFVATVVIANPPVLSIVKTHADNFAPGQQNAMYTVTVSNSAGAGPTTGTLTVTEMPPAGLTLVSMSGTGWTCAPGGTSCTTSAVLNAGASYPAIAVTASVDPAAPASLTNQVSVTGGGSSIGASASDLTTISPFSACDVGQTGSTSVADVQTMVNEALGAGAAMDDLNGDGVVSVADVQIVIDAMFGMGCTRS
jgi:uncharacterized repeat protein (TIGR01451 family)